MQKFQRLSLVILFISLSLMLQPSSHAQQGRKSPAAPIIDQPNALAAPPVIGWDQIAATVIEGQDLILAVRVKSIDPGDSVDIGITYEVYNGTAQSPADYNRTLTLVSNNQPINGMVAMRGAERVQYIKVDTNMDSNNNEGLETFFIDISVAGAQIDQSMGNRVTVTIAKDQKFYPAFADFQGCNDVAEPINNTPNNGALLAINGGTCQSDFANEIPGDSDYYLLSQATNGSLRLLLANVTPNQHDFNLYLYRQRTDGSFEFMQQSTNQAQIADSISFAATANTVYLARVYWVTSTGTATPVYQLSATAQ